MNPKLFKIKFTIQIQVYGITSYADCHTSILAYSEDEAKSRLKEAIECEVSSIQSVSMVKEFFEE